MTTALIILLMTNSLRVNHVVIDSTLNDRAQVRAQQLCDSGQWAHGDTWTDSFKGLGYRYAGENLARRYNSTSAAFFGWMGSPTHLANIKNEHYTKMGIGEDKRCDLIVQLFAGRV